MSAHRFYGRPLTEPETAIHRDMSALNPGQTIRYRAGVTVTRSLFGPWYYVQAGPNGYRAECAGTVAAAVHTRNLINAQS